MSLLDALQFRDSRCTRYRYRYSECQRCADACPHEAIALHDAGASLDAARCQSCGLCTTACQTGAWESPAYQPIDLLRQAIRQPAWSAACAPSGAAADAVVPCLGAIPAVMLAYLARRGIAVSLRGSEHCKHCAHGAKGAEQLAATLRAAESLRDAVMHDGDPAWAMPVLERGEQARAGTLVRFRARTGALATSRRQLLRRVVRRAADEVTGATEIAPASATAPPAKAIRAGAYFVPEQRDLLQIVCKRADDQPVQVPIDDVLPLMQLALEPGCTLCEACFRVCPTGALAIDENPGDWALTFQTDRCVACLVCLEVCQPRVLQAQPAVDARPEQPSLRLLAMNKQRCRRCDRHFVSVEPQQHCAVCSDDQDAFSAIFG